MFVHVCLLWAAESTRERTEEQEMWYEALSATITGPMTCLERIVHATKVVIYSAHTNMVFFYM